jgi:L-ascorbate metabolism protein UlaG (beta-lactamase superfamily)
MVSRSFFGVGAWTAASVWGGTALAATHVPPLPTVSPPVAVTETSRPWLHYKLLQRPLELDRHGFVEEEFLVSGRANVYDWPTAAGADLQVKYRDAPYTTRVLVRRPRDLSKFSGNVYVEVMNPARGYDLPIFFSYMADRMLENGDAWVGVTTGQNIEGLKRYDPIRYSPVQMVNPAPFGEWACPAPPAPTPAAGQGGGGGQGGQAAAPPPPRPLPIENGLRFDMFSQVARWLKSEEASNPLAPGEVDFVYMVSHTGGDVATYAAGVAREARQPNGGPIYDGYVIKTGSGVGALKNCGSPPPESVFPGTHGRLPGAPIVQVKMQGDVPNQRRPDSDDPNDTFRMYEVAGTAHADRWPYRYLPLNRELRKAIPPNDTDRGVVTDIYPYAHACNVEGAMMNDFPLPYVISGVLANLDAFKRNGTPMPRTEPIRTAGETARSPVVTDQHGNALGGLRTVWLDAPTKTWYAHVPGTFSTCYDMGYSVDWPLSKIQAVYGGIPNWTRQANASIDRMVAQRIVTRADGEKIRAQLIPAAATATLVPLSGDRIPTSRGDLVIRPVAHASFLMQWNGKTIYVDPTGGGEPYINLPRADLIVITDIHGDHMHGPTLQQIGAGAPVVAPQAVRDALPPNLRGMVTTVLANGQTATVDGVRIEAVPMYNTTPERTQLHTKGRGNGYVMTFGDKRIYIAGDTEPTPEMLALKDIDVAFLPMNQPFTMTPQQVADAVKAFRPKIVYPYHHRGTDVNAFAGLVGDAAEVRLRAWY